mmetsp:Transcript_1476/g.3439  ORF Transcript_1476/g.3439 Transcript_1476/m.3439 type:complete len:305 (+) Transcript_1476:1481-2395(+)
MDPRTRDPPRRASNTTRAGGIRAKTTRRRRGVLSRDATPDRSTSATPPPNARRRVRPWRRWPAVPPICEAPPPRRATIARAGRGDCVARRGGGGARRTAGRGCRDRWPGGRGGVGAVVGLARRQCRRRGEIPSESRTTTTRVVGRCTRRRRGRGRGRRPRRISMVDETAMRSSGGSVVVASSSFWMRQRRLRFSTVALLSTPRRSPPPHRRPHRRRDVLSLSQSLTLSVSLSVSSSTTTQTHPRRFPPEGPTFPKSPMRLVGRWHPPPLLRRRRRASKIKESWRTRPGTIGVLGSCRRSRGRIA